MGKTLTLEMQRRFRVQEKGGGMCDLSMEQVCVAASEAVQPANQTEMGRQIVLSANQTTEMRRQRLQ